MTRIVHCKRGGILATGAIARQNPFSGSHRARQDLAQLKPSGRGLGVLDY